MTVSALSRDTLVLNRAWLAIASTPVRNALRLVYSEAAMVVQPDTYEVHGFESWSRLFAASSPSRSRARSMATSASAPGLVAPRSRF